MSRGETRVLCVRLFGPLASWGTAEAGAASRPTARHPSRGALLGMVAAALGLGRADDQGHTHLGRSLLTAVASHGYRRVSAELRTVQSVVASKRSYASRREALATGEVVTSVTERQHVEDGLWRVFLCGRDDGTDLDTLAEAFRRPAFEFYLGRREFPLALPPDACVVDGDLSAALAAYPPVPESGAFDRGELGRVLASVKRHVVGDGGFELCWDEGFPGAPEGGRRRQVADDPFSRSAWRFRSRVECSVRIDAPVAATRQDTDLVDEFFDVNGE